MRPLILKNAQGQTILMINRDQIKTIGVRANPLDEEGRGETPWQTVVYLRSGGGPDEIVLATSPTMADAYEYLTQFSKQIEGLEKKNESNPTHNPSP